MEFVQELSLELNSNSAYSTVGAKQGDNNSRTVIVRVLENGLDYNLRDNNVTSAYFRLRKPDGKAIINTADIDYDANTIAIYLSAQALAVSGRGYADVTLMSGSSILSTISFILLIMASPQVAGQATSSNEFGYLNAVVEDATHIIYEAQAWAEGMRGSEPVYGNDSFTPEKESEVITSLSVDEASFKQKVGERPGLKRIFEFTYNQNETWGLITTTYEGNTSTQSTPEVIGNLLDYGITIGLRGGADAPDPGDKIKITIEEADKTFENNAKYYSEQAKASQEAIEALTATGEKIQAEEFNANNNYQIGDYVWYNTLINNEYQVLLYRFTSSHAAGNPWSFSEVIEELLINKTINNNIVNFHFKMPQGPRGDVNFLTFDIDVETGVLIMYRPDNIVPQVNFSLNNNDGNLYIQIAN